MKIVFRGLKLRSVRNLKVWGETQRGATSASLRLLFSPLPFSKAIALGDRRYGSFGIRCLVSSRVGELMDRSGGGTSIVFAGEHIKRSFNLNAPRLRGDQSRGKRRYCASRNAHGDGLINGYYRAHGDKPDSAYCSAHGDGPRQCPPVGRCWRA